MSRVAIGLGANLGERERTLRHAVDALRELGRPVRVSSLYESEPWGEADQPPFLNAVVLLETPLSPRDLLTALQGLEVRLGRRPSYRWGPREVDLDILTFDDLSVEEADLILPHPRLAERAFVLVPLAELDPSFAELRDRLPGAELRKVRPLRRSETFAFMPDDALVERVRALAAAFSETDLVSLRVEDPGNDSIEFTRSLPSGPPAGESVESEAPAAPVNLEPVKADLVGIARFARPPVSEGELLEGDRELAYVEALGIRTAVRSRGRGRVAHIRMAEGQPVEYGQVLFEIDRG